MRATNWPFSAGSVVRRPSSGPFYTPCHHAHRDAAGRRRLGRQRAPPGSVSSLNSDNLRNKMQPDHSLTRRVLLAAGAALTASAAEDKTTAGKLRVAIFSKHLQFLEGEALAAGVAE